VQLEEHTVSRMHAKMSLDGKTWTLSNLSRTNPAIVNGLALGEENPAVVLRDGDRIEMGEVVFRFRSR
jgi:predicted component of type VI protein secretion system